MQNQWIQPPYSDSPCQSNFSTSSAKLFARDFLSVFYGVQFTTRGDKGDTHRKYRQQGLIG